MISFAVESPLKNKCVIPISIGECFTYSVVNFSKHSWRQAFEGGDVMIYVDANRVIDTGSSHFRIGSSFDCIGYSFDDIGCSFDDIGSSFDDIGSSFVGIGGSFDHIGGSFDHIGSLFDRIGSSFDRIGSSFDRIGSNYWDYFVLNLNQESYSNCNNQ